MSEHKTTTPSDNADTSTPEGDSDELYSVLENALRNQLDVLRNRRVPNLEGAKSPGTEDDDEMDNELSRLEEAERTMRDELAAAVMEFGLSLPTSPSSGADAAVGGFGGQAMNGEGASEQDDSEEKLPSQYVPKLQQQQRGLSGSSSCPTDSNNSPEKVPATRSDDARLRSEADMIDERELYAALTDLCQWIREGESIQSQHQQQQEQLTSSPYRRHQYSPARDEGVITRRPASAHRTSPERVDNTCTLARTRPPADGKRKPASLRELEKNLPVDELCRWLNEGSSPKYAASALNRQQQGNQAFGNSIAGSNRGNQAETPHTFHNPCVTGTSSLLLLGSAAVGNAVRSPQGRSPLRKPHCLKMENTVGVSYVSVQVTNAPCLVYSVLGHDDLSHILVTSV